MIASPQFPEREGRPLEGRRVLVVEDEAIIAMDLAWTLERAGAIVLGLATTVPAALAGAGPATPRDAAPDAAIVDVSLRGEDCFAVMDALAARGVAFVVHTGHASRLDIAARYPASRLLRKPASPESLVAALAERLAGR